MKKIFTIFVFTIGFAFTASAQETSTATAAAAPKASCCASGAKTATAGKASCSSGTVSDAGHIETATVMVAQAATSGPATTEKKACKTGASCCADKSKKEDKKVL